MRYCRLNIWAKSWGKGRASWKHIFEGGPLNFFFESGHSALTTHSGKHQAQPHGTLAESRLKYGYSASIDSFSLSNNWLFTVTSYKIKVIVQEIISFVLHYIYKLVQNKYCLVIWVMIFMVTGDNNTTIGCLKFRVLWAEDRITLGSREPLVVVVLSSCSCWST